MDGTEAASSDRAARIAQLDFDYGAAAKERLPRCNLCGSDRWTTIAHADRYGYPARTVSCWTCSLTFLNPRMTADAYLSFYAGTYRPLVSAFHGRLIDAQTIKQEQCEYAVRVAEETEPWAGTAATLLDIGGSTGVVAGELARRFGTRATVIDPAPDELIEAGRAGIETITGIVEQWNPAGRMFDLVTMFQTADHLLDVAAALQTARRVLNPDGFFIIDIVDFRAAYLRSSSVEAATKIDHPYSLTEVTIEAYLTRAGFEPLHKSYNPDHLHVLYVCEPCEPAPDWLPEPAHVREQLREIRAVHNAPRAP